MGCCMRVAYHTEPAAHNLAGKMKADVGRVPGCHTWVHHSHNPETHSVNREVVAAHNLDLEAVHNCNLLEKGVGPWDQDQKHENASELVQMEQVRGHLAHCSNQEAPACLLVSFDPSQHCFWKVVVVEDSFDIPVRNLVNMVLSVDSHSQSGVKDGYVVPTENQVHLDEKSAGCNHLLGLLALLDEQKNQKKNMKKRY